VRSLIRAIGRWPLIGRPVRIAVGLIRLPEIVDQQQALHYQQQVLGDQQQRLHELQLQQGEQQRLLRDQLQAAEGGNAALLARQEVLMSRLAETQDHHQALKERVHAYETQQVPALLEALSDLNQRQLAASHDAENLVNSVPVSLRRITREMKEVPRMVERIDQLEALYRDANGPLPGTGEVLRERGDLDALAESVTYLLKRVEFIRKELMFEMRYGASAPASSDARPEVEATILSVEKFEAAKRGGALRLNLGCGHIPLEGFLNVDRRALPGVDVVADIDDLPLETGEADEIHSAHLLEHFPQEQLRRELLPYWRGLIRKGGVFRAIVPDAETMIREYEAGRYAYDELREVMFGGQDYDGDFHFNMFTPDSLKRLLLEAGFEDVELVESGRRNGACYEFEMLARH